MYKTKIPVLIADAAQESGFTHEAHVQQNNTKSVLCVPALYQSRVVAILYVENNLISGAFTSEKVYLSSAIRIFSLSFRNCTNY